jgi:outer membrane protein assembly factor BamE (lipoprotein component of BamABCDE complex)
MNKLYILFLFLILSNCSFKPVVKHHGVPFLEKKQETLVINQTNKNDIIKILGNPSTKSKFDNDLYIYIERKTTGSKLTKLGKKKLLLNNVLVLEFDNKGMLISKKFYIRSGRDARKARQMAAHHGIRYPLRGRYAC